MRHTEKILFIYILAAAISCTNFQPKEEPVKPTPKEPIQDPVKPKEPPKGFEDLKLLAANSSCAKYSWKQRGVAPKSYLKGMAIGYARALCNRERSDIKALANSPSGDLLNDVLSHYQFKTAAGIESIRKTHTLLIGLGMWESSGKHCCGKDASQNYDKADEAEAGAFQSSFGPTYRFPILKQMFLDYSKDKSKCYLEVFADQVSCSKSDAKTWGEGLGADFQKLSKSCPMFSLEYAAVLSRVNGGAKGEYSTYRNKDGEYRPECEDMLKQIEKLIEDNKDLCKLL